MPFALENFFRGEIALGTERSRARAAFRVQRS